MVTASYLSKKLTTERFKISPMRTEWAQFCPLQVIFIVVIERLLSRRLSQELLTLASGPCENNFVFICQILTFF